MQTSKEQEFTEVVSKLKKRDIDIARLREQRDQLQAELAERKHLESVKLTSANEMKVLAESRSVRSCLHGRKLELTKCQGENCCATVRSAQVEGATGSTNGRRGFDEFYPKSIGPRYQLCSGSEGPPRVSCRP